MKRFSLLVLLNCLLVLGASAASSFPSKGPGGGSSGGGSKPFNFSIALKGGLSTSGAADNELAEERDQYNYGVDLMLGMRFFNSFVLGDLPPIITPA